VCLYELMSSTPTTIEVNGFALRAIRILSGIAVADLAERVGVQRPYIAKIELGHSQRVSPKVFNALLQALVIDDRRALLANPHGSAFAEGIPA
jgi:transcriptional regulator with XRE-family HTH domain